MNREEFLEKFVDILQTDAELNFDMELETIEEWDSLSKMTTMSFLDSQFGIKVSFAEVSDLKTIEDIAKIAGV